MKRYHGMGQSRENGLQNHGCGHIRPHPSYSHLASPNPPSIRHFTVTHRPQPSTPTHRSTLVVFHSEVPRLLCTHMLLNHGTRRKPCCYFQHFIQFLLCLFSVSLTRFLSLFPNSISPMDPVVFTAQLHVAQGHTGHIRDLTARVHVWVTTHTYIPSLS